MGALMVRFVQALEEDDKKKVKELYVSGLSEYQQLQVLLKLYLKRAGEPLEATMIDLYDQALKNFIAEYHNLKVSMEQVVKLSEEQVDQIDNMIESGDWDNALKELDRFSSGQGAAETTDSPDMPPQPSDTLEEAPEQPASASEETPLPQASAVATPQDDTALNTDQLNQIVELLKSGKYDDAKQMMDTIPGE